MHAVISNISLTKTIMYIIDMCINSLLIAIATYLSEKASMDGITTIRVLNNCSMRLDLKYTF